MSDQEIKPLKWTPEPGIGYSVKRRPDGGMHVTFNDASTETLAHWRNFAIQHLYDSDRLTRNLYDLRAIDQIPEDATKLAVEANSDPAARNIRLAVVVSSEKMRVRTQEIADRTTGGGVEMKIFTDMQAAEDWLDRPLTDLI